MTVDAMRQAIIARYSDTIRGQKVAWMTDDRVIAVYRSLESRGDLTPRKKKTAKEPVYEQMRMEFLDDYPA